MSSTTPGSVRGVARALVACTILLTPAPAQHNAPRPAHGHADVGNRPKQPDLNAT